MASFEFSDDIEMFNSLDYTAMEASIAREIVEPMIEKAATSRSPVAASYTVSDNKHAISEHDSSGMDSDERSDYGADKHSQSSFDGMDSDDESKDVKTDWDEEDDMDIKSNQDDEKKYEDLIFVINEAEEELAKKDAIIAEKEQLLEEANRLFQNKHEELCMTRQEISRIDEENDAKQEEIQNIYNRMLDAEAALQMERDQQTSQGPGDHAQSPQAKTDDSQLRAEIAALTAARDGAFQFAGQATMEAKAAQAEAARAVQQYGLQMNQLQQHIVALTSARDQATAQLTEANNRLNEIVAEREGFIAKQAEDSKTMEALMSLLESQESAAPAYSFFDIAPKVSDEEVRNLWQSLYSEVVVLCSVLTRKPSNLSAKHVEIFKSIMPDKSSIPWDNYLKDDEHRKFLVEAFVWENVVRYLNDNKVWLGQTGADFRVILKHMRDGKFNIPPGLDKQNRQAEFDWNLLKKYCVWRAQGAHQLTQFGAHDDMAAHLDATVAFMELLRPLCSVELWTGQNGVEFKEIYDGVFSILSTCQKLDLVFMTSLANWKPKLARHHTCWNQKVHHHPEWFGNIRPVPGKPTFGIAFQVSPYLMRYGDADGEGYDVHEVVAKGSIMPAVKF